MKFVSIITLILSGTALAVVLNRKTENTVYLPAPATESNQTLADELLKLQMRIAALEKISSVKEEKMGTVRVV